MLVNYVDHREICNLDAVDLKITARVAIINKNNSNVQQLINDFLA